MADDTTRQSLLSGLLDPLRQANKRNTEKKRRLLRSRSAPAVDISYGLAKDGGPFPSSKYKFSNYRTSFRQLHQRKSASEEDVLKEIQTNKTKYKFLTRLGVLLLLILSGTMFLHYVEKLDLINALYCVCSTITTLGYGDKSFSTKGGRVFAVFWILTSTICLAQFFLYLAELYTERRRRKLVQWVLSRRMTSEDIVAADLDNDGVVGAAEFVIYKLKEMGKITGEYIAVVMEQFEALDVDQSVVAAEFLIYKLKEMGKITEEDIAVVMEQFEALDMDQSSAISNNDLITLSIQ